MLYLICIILGMGIYAGIDKWLDLYFRPVYNPINQLDAAQLVDVIDSKMGSGWTKALADQLKD